MNITNNVIKRMVILKLWIIGDEIVDNQSLTFTQICLGYGEALSKKYKDAENMIRAINNILGRMIKEGLIIREERGLYKITEKGIRYYHNNQDNIIGSLQDYFWKMKAIA